MQATCLLQVLIAVLDDVLMQMHNQQRNVQTLCSKGVIARSFVVQAYLLSDEGL